MNSCAFEDFYRDVHGYAPHPWQKELAEHVRSRGWPDALDIPTGLGKTSVLDIATYTFACDPRTQPRRIFFVVDRRLVVDQAHLHARKLAAALRTPTTAAAGWVADRLTAATSTAQPAHEPLAVTRLRGGLAWSARWITRPDQPAIVTGTVDQIGSRMLFRGYGTSKYARPIDAALTFADSLIFLDEAHLSLPFQQTVSRIQSLEKQRAAVPISPAKFVSMSATTTSSTSQSVFHLDPETNTTELAVRVLNARKRLLPVEDPSTAYAQAAAATAVQAAQQPGRAIVVFSNTVATARAIFQAVSKKLGEADTLLLTGRSRPADREALLDTWLPHIAPGRDRADLRSLVVVATQTLEVGADVDFDILVTEPASLDALVQRLGRLNRRGDLTETAPAIMLAGKGFRESTPVYGETGPVTWDFLVSRFGAAPLTGFDTGMADAGIDVSPSALRDLTDAAPPETRVRPCSAPLLVETHLDLWSHTSPAPSPDLPVAPFLHGVQKPAAEVSVVWRAPMTAGELDQDTEQVQIAENLALMPPTAEEMLDLPLAAVRSWLTGAKKEVPVADTGTSPAPGEDPDTRWALRYLPDRAAGSSRKTWQHIPFTELDLQPGDIVAVPARYGGCDQYGWSPYSLGAVPDLSLLRTPARRDASSTVCLTAGLIASLQSSPEPDDAVTWSKRATALFGQLADALDNRADAAAIIRDLAQDTDVPLWASTRTRLARAAAILADPRARLSDATDAEEKPLSVTATLDSTVEDSGDDESAVASSVTGVAVLLDQHHDAVARRAAAYAESLGLPPDLQRAVHDAARLHDLGKHDERFQLQLHRGDPVEAVLAEHPLAKSGMDPADRAAWRRAHILSGYPDGLRHEALSAALAARHLAASGAEPDHADLVIHLIAAHHGRTRPLMDPVTDPDPRQVTIDVDGHRITASTGDVIDWTSPPRFARLQHRYGWYGLALLETVVRLADMTCSAEGS
jgi:CRISPR-associated endonuclease/helicase Cas3